MATPAPHFVDDILEEIFLRLPTPAALARASTACPRFRRIITERSFLRRFRKRHPPPLLGFAGKDGFLPAQAPHPSAPLAHSVADAADFTYSFVPKPNKGRWRPCDVRDGRVLLEEDTPRWNNFSNLVVCDPLSRRHLLLPPIPDDLAAVLEEEKRTLEIVPILAPIGDDEDETSFKPLQKISLDIDEDSPVGLSRTDWDVDYFSLDVRTSELAKVCRREKFLPL